MTSASLEWPLLKNWKVNCTIHEKISAIFSCHCCLSTFMKIKLALTHGKGFQLDNELTVHNPSASTIHSFALSNNCNFLITELTLLPKMPLPFISLKRKIVRNMMISTLDEKKNTVERKRFHKHLPLLSLVLKSKFLYIQLSDLESSNL